MPRLTEANGGKVKPSNYQHEFTLHHAAELMKCKQDPLYFIENYCFVQHPVLGRLPLKLFDYQKKLVGIFMKNKRTIAMLSRQCGKTVTSAAFLLWWAIFQDDQKIVIISKNGDAAKDIMERLWFMYEECAWFLKPGVKQNNVYTKEFDNGSKIEALTTTASSGRGKSVSLLYLDEFAYIPEQFADAFWRAVYPVIASGGRCIITSTPNTDEDKFAKIWFSCELSPLADPWEDKLSDRHIDANAGEKYDTIFANEDVKRKSDLQFTAEDATEEDHAVDGFIGFHAHWTSVPDIEEGFRGEKFKRKILASGFTNEEWLREFECSFISADATLISPMKMQACTRAIRRPRYIDEHGCRWYEEIKPNTAYALVLDPSEGVDADDAVIQVWEIPAMVQVAEWHDNKADQEEQAKMITRTLRFIDELQHDYPEHMTTDLYYSVERNGLGIGVLNSLEKDGQRVPGWMIDSTNNKSRGLLTTAPTKKRFALEFKSLVERNLFTPRSKYLISQMKTFVRKGQGYAAKSGRKDDIIMACILMCHLIEEVRAHEPDLDDRVHVDVDDYDPDDDNHPDNMPMPIIL